MNESLVARKVKESLDAGLVLQPEVSARLKAARERALERHRIPAEAVTVAGHGTAGLRLGGVSTSWVGVPWARIFVSLAFLVAAVVGLQHWQEVQHAARLAAQQAAEIEEVDARLLTGDLPIQAYIDEDFQAWLKQSSQ